MSCNSTTTKILTGETHKASVYAGLLEEAVNALNTYIAEITSENKPLVHISIDEIDSVMPLKITKKGENGNVPVYFTMLKALYTKYTPSVLISVLSTYGYVFDIAPTSGLVSRALEETVIILHPVFTELPLNIHVEPVSEYQRLENVCNMEFISRYGRPLSVLRMLCANTRS